MEDSRTERRSNTRKLYLPKLKQNLDINGQTDKNPIVSEKK